MVQGYELRWVEDSPYGACHYRVSHSVVHKDSKPYPATYQSFCFNRDKLFCVLPTNKLAVYRMHVCILTTFLLVNLQREDELVQYQVVL